MRWVIIVMILFAPTSVFASQKACVAKAKEYVEMVPEAKKVLEEVKKAGEEKFFWKWIECSSLVMAVATSVHESVHLLNSGGTYYLLDGTRVPRITDVSPRPRKVIGKLFSKKDMFGGLYVHGKASSSDYFEDMLDELTAYTYDTRVSLRLKPYTMKGHSYRDGLSALMSFTMAYVNKVEVPSDYRRVMEAIWGQAENELASACLERDFSMDDSKYLKFLRDKPNQSGLEKLLGRPLKIPNECKA